MRLLRPVRLSPLIAGGRRTDIATRYPALDTAVPARRMRVGATMLDLFGIHDDWLPQGGTVLPAYGSQVHTILGATILSSTGILGLQTDEVIEDTLDHTDPDKDRYERHNDGIVFLQSPKDRLRGRYLSLLLGNHDNHFHWLLMNFARMAILNEEELSDLDGILIPDTLNSKQREALCLARLNDHAPFHSVKRGESLAVDTLVLPWNVASGYGVNPDAATYLRRLVPRSTMHSEQEKRKIYIDRRDAPLRRLLNEAEIIEVLRDQDVEPVRLEELSLERQIQIFQDVELVVGPHGAGLTNIAFSNPGTRIVELIPSGNLNWCYRHLAAACRHDYDCVIGRSRPYGDISPMWAPWIASPTHVLSALQP